MTGSASSETEIVDSENLGEKTGTPQENTTYSGESPSNRKRCDLKPLIATQEKHSTQIEGKNENQPQTNDKKG